MYIYVHLCLCVCLCVRMGEKEREERERESCTHARELSEVKVWCVKRSRFHVLQITKDLEKFKCFC